MKTCVIIPTYNEQKTVGELISSIKILGFDVIVVDDGSSDDTGEIAKRNSAVVLENKSNLGKGLSLRRGFEFALKENYDFIVTMDGDGQHSPLDILRFVEKAKEKDVGIIVGNRMQNCVGMPLTRKLTNHLMSYLISKIIKQDIADTQCGFRLIKKEVLEKIYLGCDRYEIESEMLIKASRAGFKIESLPIKTIYRGEKSQINPFVDTLRFLRFIIPIMYK